MLRKMKNEMEEITDGLLRCNLDLIMMENPRLSKHLLDRFTKEELFNKYKEFIKTQKVNYL